MPRRAFPGSSKVCGVPDQPDKHQERRRQSSAMTGDRTSVQDAISVIITFCPVLNGLKWAHLKRSAVVCYCSTKTPNYNCEAQVCAEKAALFSPGTDGEWSWEWLSLWYPGLVSSGESFTDDGELFRSSLRAILSPGFCLEDSAARRRHGWPGSSSPLPSFLYPLRETGIREMRRDGDSAETKCQHTVILLKNTVLSFLSVCRVLSC